MNWKKADKAYCIDECVYTESITKRQCYIIHEIGKETKEGKLRIKGNRNKFVWIPDDCFVDYEVPSILFIQIDDKIKNPKKDCIEVTVIFSDVSKRWLTFTSPQYLEQLFNEYREYIIGNHFILLKEINEFMIKKTIHHLDHQNELIKTSRVLT